MYACLVLMEQRAGKLFVQQAGGSSSEASPISGPYVPDIHQRRSRDQEGFIAQGLDCWCSKLHLKAAASCSLLG